MPETEKAATIRHALLALGNTEIAQQSQRFFKTGKGDYGEGDLFLGIRMPLLRQQAKYFKDAPLNEVLQSLRSVYHEERLCALLIMMAQFKKAKSTQQTLIYQSYLGHTHYVNNWDLVDTSAHPIVGGYLIDKPRDILYELAQSTMLWERRIAMMTTYHFIKAGQFEDTLKLAAILRNDPEDLIHKVVGWMLREMGKRDLDLEKNFLKDNYQLMPRTMLRYAIEKFPPEVRKRYLAGQI